MATKPEWASEKRIKAVLDHNPIADFAKELVKQGVTRDQLRIVMNEYGLTLLPEGVRLINYHRDYTSE